MDRQGPGDDVRFDCRSEWIFLVERGDRCLHLLRGLQAVAPLGGHYDNLGKTVPGAQRNR